MKKMDSQNIAPEFEPATRLDLNPGSADRLQARGMDALEALKQRLVQEAASASSDPAGLSYLWRAAEEAASMAWTTPFPLLVLPELFAEKAEEACLRSQCQRDIRQRSVGLFGLEA